MQESIEEVFSDVLPEEVAEVEQKQEEPKPSGYIASKEEWVAQGKDPEEWVSPEVFKERTQRIKETSRLKRELAESQKEFDNRLKNVNLLAQAQLSRQREELMSRRDDAIDIADRAAVKNLDRQINELDKEAELTKEQAPSAPKPPEVDEWEAENDWINDVTDPRTPVAQQAFVAAREKGKTIAGCLIAANQAVAAMKTEQTQVEIKKKPPLSMADSSRSASVSRNESNTLSWNQLSGEEKMIFEEFFEHTKMTKQDYLKTVADQRKGV